MAAACGGKPGPDPQAGKCRSKGRRPQAEIKLPDKNICHELPDRDACQQTKKFFSATERCQGPQIQSQPCKQRHLHVTRQQTMPRKVRICPGKPMPECTDLHTSMPTLRVGPVNTRFQRKLTEIPYSGWCFTTSMLWPSGSSTNAP